MYSFIGKKFTLPFAWTRTYCEKPIVRISCTFITKPSAVPDPTTRSGQRVLDLGTGLGISGIVAAGLGAEVLLQDRPALRAVGPSRLKWWDYINLSNCFLGNFHVARSPPEFIVNLFRMFWWCALRTHCNNVGCLWHITICIVYDAQSASICTCGREQPSFTLSNWMSDLVSPLG